MEGGGYHEKYRRSPSYIENMNAELGAERVTVIPQPRYRPARPCCLQTVFPTDQKVRWLAAEEEWAMSSVCIRDLIVSAG